MKTIFGKPVQIVVDMIHAQLIRTEKVAFHEKYRVLMNRSQNWSWYFIKNIGYSQRGRERIS